MHVADLLASWNSYYVMIGSSTAALTGLMFVVITLASGREQTASAEGISTFSTPTVVHFSCVLFTAASMAAPFRSLVPIALLTGAVGAFGLIVSIRIAVRTARLQNYRADGEDWMWHVVLPIVAYAVVTLAALTLRAAASPSLFATAAAMTLLIFIGIHNAWDVVTFLATVRPDDDP